MSTKEDEMRVNPARAKDLIENVVDVTARIARANKTGKDVRLIAVSKLKPATDILALHTAPAPHTTTHFGENYYQELSAKAAQLPRTIKWHFIGALQTNKCRPLAEAIPNLWCVSSVDTAKKADQLEKGRKALVEGLTDGEKAGLEPLRILVQVNTSGEDSKSGTPPAETAALSAHVRDKCPHLRLAGLMTIGAIARSQALTPETENEDFVTLTRVRDQVARELGLRPEELCLSMGMSADFEGAIRQGSDEVRVGTGIFGQRAARGSRIPEGAQEGDAGKS